MNFPSLSSDKKFPEQIIDPKDELISQLRAHIKTLEEYTEFLKANMIQRNSPIQTPRRQLNSLSEIRAELERKSRLAHSEKEEKPA